MKRPGIGIHLPVEENFQGVTVGVELAAVGFAYRFGSLGIRLEVDQQNMVFTDGDKVHGTVHRAVSFFIVERELLVNLHLQSLPVEVTVTEGKNRLLSGFGDFKIFEIVFSPHAVGQLFHRFMKQGSIVSACMVFLRKIKRRQNGVFQAARCAVDRFFDGLSLIAGQCLCIDFGLEIAVGNVGGGDLFIPEHVVVNHA